MSPRKASGAKPRKGTPGLSPDLADIVRRGVVQILPEEEFLHALRSGRKLRLKLGLDPSKPDLHIGHGVLLRKLRRLQELGHQVVLIVGDWTAQIGDPSGQSIMRPMLTAEEVRANAETYMRQFFHVVDPARAEVRWQSEWFGAFTLADVMRLTARFTVAQMLQREDFRQRFDAHQPLGIHELLYPLLQAYDSVAIEADVEFGGSDQLFNLLVGRELQEAMGQRPQAVFVMHLLPGTDGVQKMSKTVGNTVDFEDPPHEQYGKLMSIPDAALPDYLTLATDIPDEELAFLVKQAGQGGAAAMDVKKRLAREVVAQFHGEPVAQQAEQEWRRVHQERERPAESAVVLRVSLNDMSSNALARSGVISRGPPVVDAIVRYLDGRTVNFEIKQGPFPKEKLVPLAESVERGDPSARKGIVDLAAILVKYLRFVRSNSELRNLLAHGAIEVDGSRLESVPVVLSDGSVVRIGKHRFLRIEDSDLKRSSE